MKPPVSILAFVLLPAAALADPPAATAPDTKPAYRLVHSRTGQEVTLARAADDLAAQDVVYFGELHDNVAGHRVYAELAALLADRRADLVISFEMFERDVQGVVNDYLRGRIEEAEFLKHGRPWKDYARDYKPLVELARGRKLDVIAGNLPRSVAGKVASQDGPASPFLPRTTAAPRDRYWELFVEAMKGHPGADGAAERMYRAQCAKDDAMAESIADYLATHPHRRPLVIHCNGNFHSDYGLGTVARLAQRVPLARSAVVSMVAAADVVLADVTTARPRAHYLLLVPAPPKPPAPAKPAEKAGDAKPGEPKPKGQAQG